VRTFSFALLFLAMAYIQPVGYRSSFPTLHERMAFAASFGDNAAIRLFYGTPHDLLTDAGYTAWRVGGTMAIVAGVWGMLAAVRALRTEEESGRAELVLATPVSRTSAFGSALVAIAAGAALLWAALFAGFVLGGLAAGGSAYLALAVVAPAAVFAGIGGIASQLAPTRRLAIEFAGGALALALLLRVVADTVNGAAWLRWLTPLGWSEEMRAFAGARPAVVVLPLLAAVGLIAATGLIARRRDIGTGLLTARDSSRPRLALLGSPGQHALRSERGSLIAWALGIGGFALVMGSISHSFSTAHLSADLQRQIEKFGGASITTAAGALGLYFLFFVFAICLFACSQLAAVRGDESEGRLETLLALPVGRRSWLGGRLALATAGATALALLAGVMAWAGAAAAGGGVSLWQMLGAGANCLPATILFLGLGALAFSLVPRATVAVAYLLVTIAFLWELIGALAAAPNWTLRLSPFHEIGLVPAQPFRAGAAAIMVAVGLAAASASLSLFARRDLAA
jgi:ABC-2 type transport system permease protein